MCVFSENTEKNRSVSVDSSLFSGVYVGKYIVNWSFSVSLRLFSGVYEGKY